MEKTEALWSDCAIKATSAPPSVHSPTVNSATEIHSTATARKRVRVRIQESFICDYDSLNDSSGTALPVCIDTGCSMTLIDRKFLADHAGQLVVSDDVKASVSSHPAQDIVRAVLEASESYIIDLMKGLMANLDIEYAERIFL